MTRISTVMDEVRARIAGRHLPPGTRLPSVRAQAQGMGVSVSTVVEAYERLAAEGLIQARPGSGFYVCGPSAPLALSQIGPALEREVDPLWISRHALEVGPGTLMPGCGWLPSAWMPAEGLRRALRQTARADEAILTDYDTPLGLEDLRQLLARRLQPHGMEVAPDQILLTESGTHAIDLICRFLLEPGDTVLVDDPCYFNFHALLKAHRVQVVGVPYTPHGPDIAAFEAAVQAHAPRLYITNGAIHNPTGAVLAPVIAHRVLKIAERADLAIIEDDIYADFEPAPAPRLAAFDGLSRVIHIGSFSKTLSASVRCGYIAARPEWVDSLADLKIATSFGGNHLAARLLLTALTGSGYRRHMEQVRVRLGGAMTQVVARLALLDIRPWLVPQAGMFLWVCLPNGLSAAALARACLKQEVVLAPGNAFSQAGDADRFLRFNVAQSQDERIFTVLEQAMRQAQ